MTERICWTCKHFFVSLNEGEAGYCRELDVYVPDDDVACNKWEAKENDA